MSGENTSALSNAIDMTKTPIYGATEQQLQTLSDAQKQALEALEKRYEKPNWFKVAAGFAKPQLGGFMASLGSASEALGENIEQQRAQQLPIAEMRAKLAQTNLIMNQNKTASDMLEERRSKNLPVTPEFVREVVARAPDSSVAKSLQAELGSLQKQQELAVARIQAGKDLPGYTPSPEDLRQAGFGKALNVEPPKDSSQTSLNRPSPDNRVPFDASGSYGTPTQLLDNLEHVESSKGKATLNADTKAMGNYQFTPETLQTLHERGIDFNPFDAKQSRAAADWYLQDLLAKSGGDWNKALAAYGGFRTKDPSEYIGKVTKDVDLTKKGEVRTEKPEGAVQDWATPNQEFKVAPPPTNPNLSLNDQKRQIAEQTKESKSYLNSITSTIGDPAFNARVENLQHIGSLLGDEKVREFASRGSPEQISTIIRNSLTSRSIPDFVAEAIRKNNFVTPKDSPDSVGKFQDYLVRLANEQVNVNNMTKNPTNAKFATEEMATIYPGMQPQTAFLKTMEELHKMQRIAQTPYLLQPYANHGYSISEMMGSDRYKNYMKDWTNVHRQLGKFSDTYQLPLNLTDPNAFSGGFDYRKFKKGQ